MKKIDIPLQIYSKVCGSKNCDEAAIALHRYFLPSDCVSPPNLAKVLRLPGGEKRLIELLSEMGFLNGGSNVEQAHLPKQRYIDEKFFMVRRCLYPTKNKTFTFHLTKKGLRQVLEKFKNNGIKVPDRIEKKVEFHLTADELREVAKKIRK